MALTRRSGNRFQASIWPGFVDAMTALLLVLMFVLTIFMVVQFMLGETIAGQESELTELNAELAALAEARGLFCATVFQNRWNPAVRAAREAVAAGRLKTLVSANIRLQWCRYQNYYEALTTYATTNRWGQMTPTYRRRQHMLINK